MKTPGGKVACVNMIFQKNSFLVLGGDERSVIAANQLHSYGMDVTAFGFDDTCKFLPQVHRGNTLQEALTGKRYVLLPLPYARNEEQLNTPLFNETILLKDLLESLNPAQRIFAGKLDESVCSELKKRNISFKDYSEREDFAIRNAIPTVEGALEIAFKELPFTIHNATCLVAGFGRIGKITAHHLQSLGAKVFVTARSAEALAWIQACGYTGIPLKNIKKEMKEFQIIFNTIPHLIFDGETLAKAQKNCLIIDLASKPGGVDFETAENLHIKAIHALSLPGKTAPLTAGRIICDTVLNIIEELR